MALLLWMPLTGSLENLGLSEVTVERSGGSESYDEGKIGRGLQCQGDTFYNINPVTLGSDATIAWWEKTSTVSKVPFTLVTDTSNYGLTVWASAADRYTLNTGDGNQNPFKNGTSDVATVEDGKWHHFAVTFSNSTAKLYIDGSYAGTAQTFKSPASTGKTLRLAGGSNGGHSYDWNGMLNDFRLYDTCLSAREVREISRGLIVHYPLNTRESALSSMSSVNWNQLLQNPDFSNGTTGWSRLNSYSSISVEDGELTVTKESLDSGQGGIAYATGMTFYTDHVYYIKATIRGVTTDGSCMAAFGFIKSSGSSGENTTVFNYSPEYKTFSLVTSPATDGGKLAVRAGYSQSPVGFKAKCKNVICIDLTQMFGADNEPTKSICDAIFADDCYPYDPGTEKNLVTDIYDRSGYGHDAVVYGGISLSSETPRYNMSSVGDASSRIMTPSITSEAKSAAFWVKFTNTSSSRVVFVDKFSKLAFGIYSGSSANRLMCACAGTSCDTYAKSLISADTWYHIVVVNTGDSNTSTERKLYINGVEQTPQSTKDNFSHSTDYLQVFGRSYNTSNGFTGNLSDFRFYAAALTTEDVIDIYKTSASVDNLGNIHTYNEEEKSSNLFRYENFRPYSTQVFGWVTKNGEYSLKLNASDFHNGEYIKLLEGKFKPLTQYKFDLWMDADGVTSNSSNVPAGFKLYYTDTTSYSSAIEITVTGSSSNPKRYQHKVFYSDPTKSISHIVLYYYTGTGAFYRWDSTITEVGNSTSFERTGELTTGQIREGKTVASISKGDIVDSNRLIEI